MQPSHRNVNVRNVLFAEVASGIGFREKVPDTWGGFWSLSKALRNDDTTPPLPSDQQANRGGPFTSPLKENPPQPAPWTSGNDSWAMKEFEGVTGRAKPMLKLVLASTNRWS
jgi:hypothetical protein